MLLPLALAVEGAPPALSTAAVLGYAWLALVGTLLAYVLWFRGLAQLPVGAFSFLPLLSPVMATLLGWALLDQTLTPLQALGFVLALGAITAAQTSPPRLRTARAVRPIRGPSDPLCRRVVTIDPRHGFVRSANPVASPGARCQGGDGGRPRIEVVS